MLMKRERTRDGITPHMESILQALSIILRRESGLNTSYCLYGMPWSLQGQKLKVGFVLCPKEDFSIETKQVKIL